MKQITKIISRAFLTISILLAGLLFIAPTVSAATTSGQSASDAARNAVCEGVNATGGDCNSGGTTISGAVQSVINILSWIIGVTAVIVIIIAGMRFITAGGNENSISSARNMILYAVIGLVIVTLAQVIVRFVITKAPK